MDLLEELRDLNSKYYYFYVPKFLQGKQVLFKQSHNMFQASNKLLGPAYGSIQYRLSKNLDKRSADPNECVWFGTTISAVDEDEGWIVVKKEIDPSNRSIEVTIACIQECVSHLHRQDLIQMCPWRCYPSVATERLNTQTQQTAWTIATMEACRLGLNKLNLHDSPAVAAACFASKLRGRGV